MMRAAAVWLVIMVLAIFNGATRTAVITPRLGEHAGHVISTIVLCALILLIAWLTVGWIALPDERSAVVAGVTWLALTLAFEFLVGHYVFHTPWEKLLADYNVLRGRIWPLVLLTTLLAPLIAYRWRR